SFVAKPDCYWCASIPDHTARIDGLAGEVNWLRSKKNRAPISTSAAQPDCNEPTDSLTSGTMNVDHVEVMRRVAEIAPKLAERAGTGAGDSPPASIMRRGSCWGVPIPTPTIRGCMSSYR